LVLNPPLNEEKAKSLPPLSAEEMVRYSRHLLLPEVGLEGQRTLKSGSVLIVGIGGLGTPAATYLAAAGVGRIGLVDLDVIEKSNLQRQVLYSESDLGADKVEVAAKRLRAINPNVSVEPRKLTLSSSNALELLKDYDVVIDGTDNFPTRYLLNDACVLLGKPDIYASIFRFDGQASVFYARKGPCYRCLFPEPPPPDAVPSCADGGVLGVLPGIMGSIQAAQAISLLLGTGEPLVGRLLVFSAVDCTFTELHIKKNPQCPVCGVKPTVTKLIDYELFCGLGRNQPSAVRDVTPLELKTEIEEGGHVVLLDVREPFEFNICHLQGAKLVPLGSLPERLGELDSASETVVCCHTGKRSAKAVEMLTAAGFSRVRNLRGGVKAWAEEVDPSMPRY
jgi:adenylyltransferase/sulfurtransferase